MNKNFLEVVAVLAIGYVVLRLGLWAIDNVAYALGDFIDWLRWSAIPAVFAGAVAIGVSFFIWQMLFGRR